jgi:dimethylargininase
MFYNFSRAIVRSPGASVVNGLSEVGIKPDYNLLVIEHTKYVDTLLKLGLKVDVLDPEDTLPDSVFVEDPALTFANGTILLEPGAPSRKGERGLIQPHLTQTFDTVFKLVEGSAEGGDVLRLNKEVLIGLSDRTNELGARALKKLLLELGQESRIVETPRGVLHFKSDCSALDEDTILATPQLANSGIFENYNVILTPENEYSAANSLRVNEKLLVPNGYPRTAELLSKKFDVEIVGITEVAKLDAGLSCMSLRW